MNRAANDLETSAGTEPEGVVPATDPRAAALAAAVDHIADDARRDPRAYLRETVVPEGGE